MLLLKRIISKALACLITALIIAFVLSFFAYKPNRIDLFPIITLYVVGYGLLIGLPCSFVADGFIKKLPNNLYFLMGLVIHLCFGMLVVYLFIQNDDTLNIPLFIYPALFTAVGIWLLDMIFKRYWTLK
ncbi:hypothetical protein [Cohnella hongkongensis]|uniref:DUF3021 domain-containing protein n=1 Tax=Cohnella hongkongensis TaxID=178337 RepID=A0ABV9FGS9_9BACL